MKPDVTEFPSEEQDQFTTKLISTKKHNQSNSDEDVSSVYIFFFTLSAHRIKFKSETKDT